MKRKINRLLNLAFLLFIGVILSGCKLNETIIENHNNNSSIYVALAEHPNHSNINSMDRKDMIQTSVVNPEDTTGTLSSNSNNSFVSKLAVASKIDQLICVIGKGSSKVTVTYYIKNTEGIWNQQFSTTGDGGDKGITYHKKEGDKKTPAGLFSFTTAFGIKPNPGTKLPYRRVTKYDYWVDDIKSPHYNTWVNAKKTPGKYKSEHLIEHSPSYNYALNINYNPDCEPGLGSAIFLHCKNKSGSTTGCIAIPEKTMKILLKKIDASTMILIVPNKKDLAKYNLDLSKT